MRLFKLVVSGFAGILLIAIVYYVARYVITVNNLPAPIESPATVKIPTNDRITFFAFGDSGTGNMAQQELAKTMERRCRQNPPAGILLLGDAVYPKGVKSVEDKKWQKHIFDMYGGECLGDVPIYPVLGNHDYEGDVAAWYRMAERNPRWQYPNRHYTIKVGDLATIYAIDTNYPIGIAEALPDFDKDSERWKIAIGHHPLWAQSSHGGGHKGKGIRPWRLRQLFCDNLDTYLTGHSHQLEYSKREDCAVDQYISGAAGARLYGIGENDTAEFVRSEYGFLEVEISQSNLIGRFISLSGDILFENIKLK